MARLFDDAQDEYLSRNQAVLAGTPLAMVCWWKGDDTSHSHSLMSIADDSANDNRFTLYAHDTGPGHIAAWSVQQGVGAPAGTTAKWPVDTWCHVCGIWATPTDRRCFLNGGSKGTNTTNLTPANLDRTVIAAQFITEFVSFASGAIAEAAIWDLSALPGDTDSDKADYFEANVLPGLVAKEPPDFFLLGLIAYWELRDNDEDPVGGFDMTPYNNPSWTAHPPMIHRSTYHFNGHSSSQWLNPANLNDGSLATFAKTISDNYTHNHNSNTCPGTDLGTISKVEMRVYGYTDIANGAIQLRPVFTGGQGDDHDAFLGTSAEWSSYFDITDDTNAPESWDWSDVQDLNGKVIYKPSVSDYKYAAKVEIRVTYEIPEVKELAGTAAAQSVLSANIKSTEALIGTAIAQSALAGNVDIIAELAGAIAVQSALTGNLEAATEATLGGTVVAKSSLTGDLLKRYEEMPPFMEKDLIDPFASGAWLWLVEIVVPTQDAVRIARNTEDVHYDGEDFEKFNIQIGEQIFNGEGSIPRVTLRTFQDVTRKIENIINETEGALGGAVKLIRVNEKFLTSPVDALEADYDLLASESDSEWCTFTLGVPNPLTQRYPLRDYSSSVCPWTSPELFKGPRCQLDPEHEDTTCTGTYEDCYGKGNAEHWGGELGLSPSVIKERGR